MFGFFGHRIGCLAVLPSATMTVVLILVLRRWPRSRNPRAGRGDYEVGCTSRSHTALTMGGRSRGRPRLFPGRIQAWANGPLVRALCMDLTDTLKRRDTARRDNDGLCGSRKRRGGTEGSALRADSSCRDMAVGCTHRRLRAAMLALGRDGVLRAVSRGWPCPGPDGGPEVSGAGQGCT